MKKIIISIMLIIMVIPFATGCRHDEPTKETSTIPSLLINEKAPPLGASPSDYSPIENLQFAAYKFNHTQSWEALYSGEVTAVGTKQQVRNKRIYDNGVLFCEALSVSTLKKVGEQKYFRGDNILVRSYKKIDQATITATWNDTVNKISSNDYYTKYGLKPNEIFKYIISPSTVISSERIDSENFTYRFVLSPNCAEYLKREVRAMAGSRSDAEYLEVECTVEMDKNWNIIKTTTKESYKISIILLGNITCTSVSNEEFKLNGSFPIPDNELFESFLVDDK